MKRPYVVPISLILLAAAWPLFAQASGAEPPKPGTTFEGRASWYGDAFQGRPTSSGELFDKEGLTAAHRSLPFGTLLRVTNRSTGASVVVRVNDRGPFVGDRVIDLSEAAARLIGLIPEGTGYVSCFVLAPEEAAAFGIPPTNLPNPQLKPAIGSGVESKRLRIQVASFRDRTNAAATLERLRLSGIVASLEEAGVYHRIVIAAVPESELNTLVARLGSLGYRSLLISPLP